jgi:hypothetical protein
MNEIQQVEASPELSYGQWEDQGRSIAKVDHANRWSLADWLAVGEKWQTRNTYDFAQRIFPDYSRKHLQELAYVARSVKLPVRQEGLSFTHHQLVTAMEPADQTRWLTWAVKQKPSASVSTLRSAISAERMTESPFAVPLPIDLLEKVKVLACTTGLTAEALVIKAVTALVVQSAEEIKKESAAAVAKEEARAAAADARIEMQKLLEKALRVAQKEWVEKATLLQAAYVKDNMPEDVVRLGDVAREVCRDALAVKTAANEALKAKPDDEKLQQAAREAAKTLDNAAAAFRDGPYQECRKRLVAEATEKFPATPPEGLQRRAQVARAAANLAAYELRQLTSTTRLADEAEQLAREAEAKVTPEALAAEADEIKRGPQLLYTPSMFEEVPA